MSLEEKKKVTKKKNTKKNVKKNGRSIKNTVTTFVPFSKQVVNFSRWESWLTTLALFFLVWMEKDVTGLTEVTIAFIGGYMAIKSFYIWMAKTEHVYDKKLEMLERSLENSSDAEAAKEAINEVNGFMEEIELEVSDLKESEDI